MLNCRQGRTSPRPSMMVRCPKFRNMACPRGSLGLRCVQAVLHVGGDLSRCQCHQTCWSSLCNVVRFVSSQASPMRLASVAAQVGWEVQRKLFLRQWGTECWLRHSLATSGISSTRQGSLSVERNLSDASSLTRLPDVTFFGVESQVLEGYSPPRR